METRTTSFRARRVVVVVNASARRVVGDPELPARLRRAVGRCGEVHVTGHAAEVPDVLRSVGALDDTLVAVCGGDGTGMVVLSALRAVSGEAHMPAVALLPAGTVNTVARRLGAHGRPEPRLAGLVERIRLAAPLPGQRHRTLVADGHVGFIFGAGLVSNFFSLYNESAAAGRVWAAAQVGRIFAGSFLGSAFAARVMAPVEARITIDGAPSPLERVSLLLASTLVDVGLGLRVTYRADRADGGFHVVATDLPAHRLGPQLPRVLAGRPLRADPLVDAIARDVRVDFARPARYLVDGELLPGQHVRLQAGPEVLFVC